MGELDDWKKQDQIGFAFFVLFAALHASYGHLARGGRTLFNYYPDGWADHLA